MVFLNTSSAQFDRQYTSFIFQNVICDGLRFVLNSKQKFVQKTGTCNGCTKQIAIEGQSRRKLRKKCNR
ncbi:1,4-dihydroxy-2-naphthoyl-CoA hydrolase [Dirofilaria immitis]